MASNGHALTGALPNANGNHAPTTNGEEDHIASIWTRYEHLKYSDVMKNLLLEVRRASTNLPVSRSTASIANIVD